MPMDIAKEKRPTIYPHELEWFDAAYDAGLCACRTWNGGFGGQCQNGVDITLDEMDSKNQRSLKNKGVTCIDGWGDSGGFCRKHANQIKNRGDAVLGYFELCPPCGPLKNGAKEQKWGWKWLNAENFAKRTGGDPKTCRTGEDCEMEIREGKEFNAAVRSLADPIPEPEGEDRVLAVV
jgi:hypothetical protein